MDIFKSDAYYLYCFKILSGLRAASGGALCCWAGRVEALGRGVRRAAASVHLRQRQLTNRATRPRARAPGAGCPLKTSHDWSACPWAHPKEQARRRDPRRYYYLPVLCPFAKSVGRRGAAPGSCWIVPWAWVQCRGCSDRWVPVGACLPIL
jgi:hypothetical protein